MVRLGTVLYGQYPSEQVPRVPGLNAGTFALKARVLAVRDLPAGATVGYGSERTVTRQTRALVVGIGFADGFGMSPDSMYRGRRGVKRLIAQCFGVSPHVRIDGVDLAVLGRVAMQTIVVDAAPMKREVQVGDVVDVPVRRLAVGAHVPRIEKPA
jgi:alanine racemase